jgi:hypothetical protein
MPPWRRQRSTGRKYCCCSNQSVLVKKLAPAALSQSISKPRQLSAIEAVSQSRSRRSERQAAYHRRICFGMTSFPAHAFLPYKPIGVRSNEENSIGLNRPPHFTNAKIATRSDAPTYCGQRRGNRGQLLAIELRSRDRSRTWSRSLD